MSPREDKLRCRLCGKTRERYTNGRIKPCNCSRNPKRQRPLIR